MAYGESGYPLDAIRATFENSLSELQHSNGTGSSTKITLHTYSTVDKFKNREQSLQVSAAFAFCYPFIKIADCGGVEVVEHFREGLNCKFFFVNSSRVTEEFKKTFPHYIGHSK